MQDLWATDLWCYLLIHSSEAITQCMLCGTIGFFFFFFSFSFFSLGFLTRCCRVLLTWLCSCEMWSRISFYVHFNFLYYHSIIYYLLKKTTFIFMWELQLILTQDFIRYDIVTITHCLPISSCVPLLSYYTAHAKWPWLRWWFCSAGFHFPLGPDDLLQSVTAAAAKDLVFIISVPKMEYMTVNWDPHPSL